MFEVFESEISKKKKNHLRNLVILAKLDGVVSKEELDFLFKVGARNGVSALDIEKMLKKTSSVKVFVAESEDERLDIVYDLIEMILADGIMEEFEVDFAIDLAIKLGFKPSIAGVLVRKIAVDIIDGMTKKSIYEKVKGFLDIKGLK